jgi:DNA-directed RNA polymerase specialized sigma24 family protein
LRLTGIGTKISHPKTLDTAMESAGSVTRWVTALKDGDGGAAQAIWERFHRRLVGLAREKLRNARRRAADEEDVVQNAFHSFFDGVSRGRFPRLDDRDNLWRVLVVITARKALDQLAHEHTGRQGGGTLQGESRISPTPDGWDAAAIDQVVGDEPTPEFAAHVAEEYERLLNLLGDDTLRRVAVWKMEGLTTDEIATQLDCSRRSVARKLETIRVIWSESSTDGIENTP